MTTRVIDLFLDPGDHASRPASATVPVGSLYPCTDHGIERNDADASWPLWDPASSGLDEAAIVALVNDGTTPSDLRAALDAIYSAGGFSGDGADLTGGPVPTAVLGSNTADATTYLRGDGTWATPSGGGGGSGLQLTSVRVAATANVSISGLANGATQDGVVLATGDRILLRAQNTGSENGPYTVPAVGPATRTPDADTTGDLVSGNFVYVSEGSIFGGQIFQLTTSGAITIGTTAQTWNTVGPRIQGNSVGSGFRIEIGPGAKVGGDGAISIGHLAGGSTGIQGNSIAHGFKALYSASTGNSNIGIGASAGDDGSGARITTGSGNVHVGTQATGDNTSFGVSVGHQAKSHTQGTALGAGVRTTQTYQTHTGPRAFAMTKMATPHTTSGSSNDGELMVVASGTDLVLKLLLDSKVMTLAHELGVTYDQPFTTAGRPSAATVGAGATYYDTTLSKPVWSDGTNWKDAAGTTV